MCPSSSAAAPHAGRPDSPESDMEWDAPAVCGPTGLEDEQTCWICLDGSGVLSKPCACPRHCHQQCMARWQLQQAGKSEEKFCRFCLHELPDWKSQFTDDQVPGADPVMVVTLGNKVHRIKVKPGEEGQREFQNQIRALFKIPQGVDFEVTFRCKAPTVGGSSVDSISLEGMGSYNAATHCASVMAARRVASNNTKGAFRRKGNEIVDCMV